MTMPSKHEPVTIAIIGAGLAGVVLALTLQQQGIQSRIYEVRRDSYSVGGSISLAPNGLRVLDAVGIYERIRPHGCSFETIYLHNLDTNSTVAEGEGLEAAYGYKSLRIARKVLIDELRSAAAERGIVIEYDYRFSHVISEDITTGIVTFASTEGVTRTANLLVGADGIHSRVREHIASVTPEYTGLLGIGATVPMAALRSVESQKQKQKPNEVDGYKLPLNFRGHGGAVAMVPCTPDNSLVAVITGSKVPDRSREEWEQLYRDKDASRKLFATGLADYPAVVKAAVEAADPAEFIFWPVHQVPRLESWVSPESGVAIMGDAAHAVPPTTGQGSNQAFEDAFMLGLVLSQVSDRICLAEALHFWQEQRKRRVFGMIDRYLGKQAGGKDPIELRSVKLSHDDSKTRGDDWLYNVDLRATVENWSKGKC